MFSKKSPYIRLAILRLIQKNKFVNLTPSNMLKINQNQDRKKNGYIFGKKIFDARDILLEVFDVAEKANRKKILVEC